jgi:hypothetical protein
MRPDLIVGPSVSLTAMRNAAGLPRRSTYAFGAGASGGQLQAAERSHRLQGAAVTYQTAQWRFAAAD